MYFRLKMNGTLGNIYQNLTCTKLLAILDVSGSFSGYYSHIIMYFLSGELNKALESADQAILLDFTNPVSFSVTLPSHQQPTVHFLGLNFSSNPLTGAHEIVAVFFECRAFGSAREKIEEGISRS